MALDDQKARIAKAERAKQQAEQAKKNKERAEAQKRARGSTMAKRRAAESRAKSARLAARRRGAAASGMQGPGNSISSEKAGRIISEYTVKKGDTLSQIAKNYYGSGSQKYWKIIQDANRDTIKDPNLIYPGQVFKIPELPGDLKK